MNDLEWVAWAQAQVGAEHPTAVVVSHREVHKFAVGTPEYEEAHLFRAILGDKSVRFVALTVSKDGSEPYGLKEITTGDRRRIGSQRTAEPQPKPRKPEHQRKNKPAWRKAP